MTATTAPAVALSSSSLTFWAGSEGQFCNVTTTNGQAWEWFDYLTASLGADAAATSVVVSDDGPAAPAEVQAGPLTPEAKTAIITRTTITPRNQ